MNKQDKFHLLRILTAVVFFVVGEWGPFNSTISIVVLLIAYVIVGYKPIISAIQNLFKGQVFDENFLMTIATVGALALQQWPEAVEVMLFYQIGSLFENLAVGRSRKSISDLMDIRPDYANLIKDGVEKKVDPYDVAIGSTIIVKPGEKVPLDGVVLEGVSSLDTSALTGESIPRNISEGEDISSGCININGVLKIQVTSLFEESTVSQILDLVENAGSKKAQVEKFITRFSRYYTPAVVFAAVALAIIPPLLFGQSWDTWIYRGLLFLIISCPCALVISVPLSFFGGIGAGSKAGILIKGSNFLEILSKTKTVIFDKTGTLTTGTFKVTTVDGPEDLLKIAAHVEMYSSHPISLSIKEAYDKELDKEFVSNVEEIAGKGIKAEIDGKTVYAGNERLLNELGIFNYPKEASSTLVYIVIDNKYYGYIGISDTIKEDSKLAISNLKKEGINKTVMLTGDRDVVAQQVGSTLGLDKVYSQLLPKDKVDLTEKIIEEESGYVAFVGDGINDAPVLARADVGIAMGGLGSQAAIEAADVVIMDDMPSKISLAMKIAKKTLAIAKSNIIFALGVKGLVLALGAFGFVSMGAAIFADVGVSVIAIMNAMRTLLITRKSNLIKKD